MTFKKVTTTTAFKASIDSGDLTIVNIVATFYGSEIPPCDQIASKFDELFTAKNLNNYTALKIDVDDKESRDLTEYLKVPAGVSSVYPLIKIFKDGEEKFSLLKTEYNDVKDKIESVLGEKLEFPPSPVTVLDDLESFESSIKNGVSVVDFWATWCGPCIRVAPAYKKLASELSEKAEFYKVDVDENAETSEKAKIRCMPTFKIYKDGEEVDSLEGADISELRKKLDDILAA